MLLAPEGDTELQPTDSILVFAHDHKEVRATKDMVKFGQDKRKIAGVEGEPFILCLTSIMRA